MFTGIVQALGEIRSIEPRGDDTRVGVGAGALDLDRVTLGDSIAVNGVCLTATAREGQVFYADVSQETLSRTTFREMKVGARVNLETALTLSTPLGGHLVSGHVDGVGLVAEMRAAGRSQLLAVTVPTALTRYIAPKGSICIDGVSLTVNAIEGERLSINLVPHTLDTTTFGDYRPGRHVNIEVDLIARYLERLIPGAPGGGINAAFLAEHGFLGPR
jgi:riboflavin synthase